MVLDPLEPINKDPALLSQHLFCALVLLRISRANIVCMYSTKRRILFSFPDAGMQGACAAAAGHEKGRIH